MAQVQGLPPMQIPAGLPRTPMAHLNPGQRMPGQFQPGAMPMGNFQRAQFPTNIFYRPYKPMLVGVEVDYEGKKLRKSMMRKTVDYNAAVIRHLSDRVWQRDFRDRRAIQPDVTYYPELCPPSAYLDNAVNAVTTRYTKVATNKMRCPIFCLSWTPEGRRLITGASSGEFTLWNGLTYNFETILQAHDASVRTMVWSHDDGWMVTGDHNGFIKYWQSNMNNVKMFQAHKEPLRGVSFSPSDQKFATCSDDGTVRIWDFIRCHEERILRGHGADVKCVDWHPHKGLIVSGSKDNQQPIKLWDPRSGTSLTTLHSHKSTVMDVKWNQNGNWLLTASRDHLVKVFDIRQLGNELQVFRGHKKEAVCLSWNPIHEALFTSGGSDGAILFWHVGIDKEVGAIENAHDNMIWSLSWHPMGHLLASGANDHTTKFWTRNRPGDKMKDKYNLNVLPSTIPAEDAEWEDKSTYVVASNVDKTVKEEKINIFTSVDDIVVPGLDFTGKVLDVSRSKVTSSSAASSRSGPVEYIAFDESKIPKGPVPISMETTTAMKLLEASVKVVFGVKEQQPETGPLAVELMRLGFPQYIEKPNDETEPVDVKLLPFVTHIIAGGQVVKSEGKSEVFGAARNSLERFYESLAKRGFFYERRPFRGERTTLNNLTEEELASYDGEGPIPERIIPSPSPARSPTPVGRDTPRRKQDRRRDFEEEDFAGKRGRFEERSGDRDRHDDRYEDRRRRGRDRREREERRDSFEEQGRGFDGPGGRFGPGFHEQQHIDDGEQYPDDSFWDDGDERNPHQEMPPWKNIPFPEMPPLMSLMDAPMPLPSGLPGRMAPAGRGALSGPPGGDRRPPPILPPEEDESFAGNEPFALRPNFQDQNDAFNNQGDERLRGPPLGLPGPPLRLPGPPRRPTGPMNGPPGHLLPGGVPPLEPHGPLGPPGPRGPPPRGGGPRMPLGIGSLFSGPMDRQNEFDQLGRPGPQHSERAGPGYLREGPPGRGFGHDRGGLAGREREPPKEPVRGDQPFLEEDFREGSVFGPGRDNFPPRNKGGRPDFEGGPDQRMRNEFENDRGGRGRGRRRPFDEENGGFRGGPPGRGFRGESRGNFGDGERWRNEEDEFYEEGPHGRGFPPDRGGHRGHSRGREEFQGGPPRRGHLNENGNFRGRGRENRGRNQRGSHDGSFDEDLPFHGEPRNNSRGRGRSPHEGIPRSHPEDRFNEENDNRRPVRDRKPRRDEEYPDDRGPRRAEERESGRGGRSSRSRGREPPRGR